MNWLASLRWRDAPFIVAMTACGVMVVFALINAVTVTMTAGDQKCVRWQTIIVGKVITRQCIPKWYE